MHLIKRMFSAQCEELRPTQFSGTNTQGRRFWWAAKSSDITAPCSLWEGRSLKPAVGESGTVRFHFKPSCESPRRDNYTWQECGRLLREFELEFDHIIPRSLGGTSGRHHISLTCMKCNRKRANKCNSNYVGLRFIASSQTATTAATPPQNLSCGLFGLPVLI